MCGICFFCSPKDSERTLKETSLLCRRGPDHSASVSIELEHFSLTFFSTVLHIRGDTIQAQPLLNGRYIFQWNGEAYDDRINQKMSDTTYVFHQICTAENEASLYEFFESIKGPFSFCLYDKLTSVLYFARDRIGRRSLLFKHTNSEYRIASVSSNESFNELSSDGIYKLKIQHDELHLALAYKWNATCFVLNPSLPIGQGEFYIEDDVLESTFDHLKEAVRRRIRTLKGDRALVLFSGGLDSLALAAILNDVLPTRFEIELVNVAFENPRFLKNAKDTVDQYGVPDRITGIQAFTSLKLKFPSRKWRFIMSNVSVAEMESQKDHVIGLISPSNTVMDLSIGIALWFASRASGICYETGEEYTSDSKVIFSGLGVDEQLGGYGRHRMAYKRNGWSGLINELQLDVSRISNRNLGRDDRVISDNSREVRFPFLDEELVTHFSSLPVWKKCQPDKEAGIGDKILLRIIVRKFYHLDSSAPKRAIQFGAKTAKIFDSSEKGTQILR